MSITPELYEFIVRVVEEKVKYIRVTREEFDKLVERVDRLVEAVNRLAEAQARTEERVDKLSTALNRLAEAQARTEERVDKLAKAIAALQKGVGRLSETVGFGLEDIAKVVLPGWLQRHLEVEVETLERRFVRVDGREVEVDLYGEGSRRGKRVLVLGECKSRIGKGDVARFYDKVYKPIVPKTEAEAIGVLFGYLIRPEAQEKAEKLGLYTVASYQR